MISFGTMCGSICGSVPDSTTNERLKIALPIDAAICLIFGILAALGHAEVLPYAAGITFSVLTILQALVAGAIRSCAEDQKSGFGRRY